MVFGEVKNAEIVKVETRAKNEETFEEAKIIMNNGKRFYFKISKKEIVRGLSKNGEVIEKQGG